MTRNAIVEGYFSRRTCRLVILKDLYDFAVYRIWRVCRLGVGLGALYHIILKELYRYKDIISDGSFCPSVNSKTRGHRIKFIWQTKRLIHRSRFRPQVRCEARTVLVLSNELTQKRKLRKWSLLCKALKGCSELLKNVQALFTA